MTELTEINCETQNFKISGILTAAALATSRNHHLVASSRNGISGSLQGSYVLFMNVSENAVASPAAAAG